jgi:hypothetical protein
LTGSVIYARDLGDQRNAELIAQYPARSAYRYLYNAQGGQLTLISPSTTADP